MTQWLVPFVYENRKGLNPNLFRDSPAGNVHGISIKVDSDVFVYSPALLILGKEYKSLQLKMCLIRIASLILPVFFLILIACSIANRKPGKLTIKTVERLRIILILLLPICAGLFLTQSSCYFRTTFNTKQKHPEMAAEYISLLNKYRDNGVITEATYQKRLKIIRDLSK